MSRNGSGTYTLPAGNPVVAGTTITANWANTTLSDLGTEMTDSLDRSGKGGMLAQFKAFDGTSGAPGWSWASELDSGVYRVGSKDFKFQVNAVTLQEWTATSVAFPLGLTATVATGSAVTGTATGGNGKGGSFTGQGSGAGAAFVGGATGSGLTAIGSGAGNGATLQGGLTGYGVVATGGNTSGGGVFASAGSGTGIGGTFTGGGTSGSGIQVQTNSDTAAMRLVPQSAPTTAAHSVGHMYSTSAGKLMICTVAGTPGTFVAVGTQT